MSLSVIYRCCELETFNLPKKSARPDWFSKEECLENLIAVFGASSITAIHDGRTGPLYNILQLNKVNIVKIEKNSNKESLLECYKFAATINSGSIYFIEDDYLHHKASREILKEGLELAEDNFIVTLYDHPDRYTRIDDIDYGKSKLYVTNSCHWRTAESTTCTWAINHNLFKLIQPLAEQCNLQDRDFFRHAYRLYNRRLISPIPGFSTHCHLPFLSPFFLENFDGYN